MFIRHHQEKRSSNILFVIFRLILSMVMFAVLVGGIYLAYKHFSGFDPLKLDPQASLSASIKSGSAFLRVLSSQIPTASPVETPKESPLLFRFLLISDSHNNNTNLEKAINQAKVSFPDLQFIIGLGDYTDVGTVEELKNAKKVFDSSALRYFLIPGDHDLWDCRNRQLPPTACFKQVFGPAYQSFVFDDFQFLLLDNSDNYIGFDSGQLKWITGELEKTKNGTKGIFVLLHEPLYHPSSDHFMGRVEPKLKLQAQSLTFQLKAAGVKKIFSGDTHVFGEFEEPVTKLSMVTVGAVAIERNPQASRFGVVSVSEDGSTKVEDVEIK